MNYLQELDIEEIKYICSVIPHQEIILYFKKNPKEFSKIRPGFRPTSISQTDSGKIIFDYRNKDFIASFIAKHIDLWMKQIGEELDKRTNKDMDYESAYIEVLPYSYFSDNISLYFKIKGEVRSEDYIVVMNAAIKAIKQNNAIEKVKNQLKREFEAEKKSWMQEIERKQAIIDGLKKDLTLKYAECRKIQEKMKEKDSITQKLESMLDKKTQEQQRTENEKYEAVRLLEADAKKMSELKEQIKLLSKEKEAVISAKKQKESRIHQQQKQPLHPNSIEEFEEYFEYNLNAIGFKPEAKLMKAFLRYSEKLLFEGTPILMKCSAAKNMAVCLSNTLQGKKMISTLIYTAGITGEEIQDFLVESKDRVVCLDGFIGNFNEIELLAILSSHRDKIIFVTYMYDGTLRYMPTSVIANFNFISLDRIDIFSKINDLSEDSSVIREMPYSVCEVTVPNNRYQRMFKEIIAECGIQDRDCGRYSLSIKDDTTLCDVLMFTILPFVMDVTLNNPYVLSRRLQKYAGETGRCQNKDILMEWFG